MTELRNASDYRGAALTVVVVLIVVMGMGCTDEDSPAVDRCLPGACHVGPADDAGGAGDAGRANDAHLDDAHLDDAHADDAATDGGSGGSGDAAIDAGGSDGGGDAAIDAGGSGGTGGIVCSPGEVKADCPCTPRPGLECVPPALPAPGGILVCREGTRFCRDGLWTVCEPLGEYIFIPN